jgi:hypothetical protein
MNIDEHKQLRKKNFHKHRYIDIDDKDFSIKPLKKMRLIDSILEIDDECEFEMNMYNFGDEEDLPDSDRAMDKRCKNK